MRKRPGGGGSDQDRRPSAARTGRRRRQLLSSGSLLLALHALTLITTTSTTCTAAAAAITTYQGTTNCNWRGSGIPAGGGAVQAVTLSCSSGHIQWPSPPLHSAAVRVILQLTPRANLDFVACLALSAPPAAAADHMPLMYVDSGGGRLEPLAPPDISDGRDKCFQSADGQLVLFLEARPAAPGPGGDPRRPTEQKVVPGSKFGVTIEYHLQPLEEYKKLHSTPDEECRPCTDEELLMAYCTSDFVVRGQISHVYHDYHSSYTDVGITAARVYREVDSLAPKRIFDWHVEKSSHQLTGTVRKPVRCGVRAPDRPGASFMLMGTVRLGSAHLTCSPTLTRWNEVKERATRDGTEPCELLA